MESRAAGNVRDHPVLAGQAENVMEPGASGQYPGLDEADTAGDGNAAGRAQQQNLPAGQQTGQRKSQVTSATATSAPTTDSSGVAQRLTISPVAVGP